MVSGISVVPAPDPSLNLHAKPHEKILPFRSLDPSGKMLVLVRVFRSRKKAALDYL